MEQIRSFIAVELPAELKTWLTRLQARLKAGEPSGVKWVNPDGIHLTLKFLGNVATDRIEEITRAIEAAARGTPPFALKVSDPGVFPNLRRPQVVWVGLGGGIDKLSQIQQNIESNLAKLGFAPESRPFTPHLTLARLRDWASPDDRQKFGQFIADTRFEEAYTFPVDIISLMKSQLTREGAIYSRISAVELKKPL
ncbi:RNA 2',3'-cyclic phosphodiesterase [subsurface metagenome]